MLLVNGTTQPLILASQSAVASASFGHRVEVAAAAGFDALGISLEQFNDALASGLTTRDMQSILTATGMRILQIDAIVGFAIAPEAAGRRFDNGVPSSTREEIDTLFQIAEIFGAEHITTVGSFGLADLEPAAVERFASLCDRAASVGTKLDLEFVGDANLRTVEQADELVTLAGASNGGIEVDIWHHVRSGTGMAALKALSSDHLFVIQMCDGPSVPVFADYMEDTTRTRLPPGCGDFNTSGFLEAIYSTGASAPVSVEVISDDLAAMDPGAAARLLAESTRKVLDATTAVESDKADQTSP